MPVSGNNLHCKVYHLKSEKKVQAMILNCPIPKFRLVTKLMLVQIVCVCLQKVTLITVKDYHYTCLSLKERNMLTNDTSIFYYKSRESSFLKFFDVKDSFVFYANAKGQLLEIGIRHYDACEWRLFTDSSKQSVFYFTMTTYQGPYLLPIQCMIRKVMVGQRLCCPR